MSERKEATQKQRSERERLEDATLLSLKMEKGVTNQGIRWHF